jgi:hypothetical protein
MKNKIFITLSAILFCTLTLNFGNRNLKYPNGSPPGYTGSPGDGQNCVACHNGSATTVSNWITSNVPAAGYSPGTTYTISVTITGSGSKGFEVSPQNLSGTLLGTLTAGAGSKLVGNGKYVTQSSPKNTNPAVWTFSWTAPIAGTGSVIMYGAFTVNEPVTKLSTLEIPENVNTSITDGEAFSFILFPNPARESVNLQYFLKQETPVKIEMLNSEGMVIRICLEEIQSPGEKFIGLPLADISGSGLFLVRISSNSGVYTRKLIVH